jgi:hypothetical protein
VESIHHYFVMANEAKQKSLTNAIYLDIGREYFVERFGDIWLGYLIWIAFFFSFIFQMTESYPGGIDKHPHVKLLTTIGVSIKFALHLWVYKLAQVPTRYKQYAKFLHLVIALIAFAFQIGSGNLIAKKIPNSELKTSIDHWNIWAPAMKEGIEGCIYAWSHRRVDVVAFGGACEILERISVRRTSYPILSIEDREVLIRCLFFSTFLDCFYTQLLAYRCAL